MNLLKKLYSWLQKRASATDNHYPLNHSNADESYNSTFNTSNLEPQLNNSGETFSGFKDGGSNESWDSSDSSDLSDSDSSDSGN